jgi:hypothetical protein
MKSVQNLLVVLTFALWAAACARRDEPKVESKVEPAVHCYFVAFQFQSDPAVKLDSAVGNSFICAPGEPGTRAVVESIQKRLKDVLLAAKKPTAVVILNIMPAEDK